MHVFLPSFSREKHDHLFTSTIYQPTRLSTLASHPCRNIKPRIHNFVFHFVSPSYDNVLYIPLAKYRFAIKGSKIRPPSNIGKTVAYGAMNKYQVF
jgi:hypothetical protein